VKPQVRRPQLRARRRCVLNSIKKWACAHASQKVLNMESVPGAERPSFDAARGALSEMPDIASAPAVPPLPPAPPPSPPQQAHSGSTTPLLHERHQDIWTGPTDADKLLVASENMLAAEEKREEIERLKCTGHSIQFQLRRPKDILRKTVVAPFSFDEVPRPIADLAREFSSATGFDRSGIIVAATVAAASVIDDRYQLAVNAASNWFESARLWAVLIGAPSAGKTPTIRCASDAIKRMHDMAVAQWLHEIKDEPPETCPPRPALYTSDATIPALSDRLRDNPRGILMLTEEFSSWIGGIDSADRGEAATNRGHWLQLYDGGGHQIDRVGRGSFLVPNWGASVLAACTPAGLRQHMRQLPDDGLIHRFIPVVMSSPDLDAVGDCRDAVNAWAEALRWLYEKSTANAPTPPCEFSPEAAAIFQQEHRAQRVLTDQTSEFSPAFASHLGKFGGMLARVALVFHLLSDNPRGRVSADTLRTAIRFMHRVRQHSNAMFEGILGASPAWTLARSLARSIVADASCITTVGRDWMTQHCGAFRKESDDHVKREAVRILEDADWLEAKIGKMSYGGWPRQWTVHERLFDMFAREGEQWRAHRAAVKAAIQGDGNEDDD
jgi:hypothetical protein